MKRLLLYCISFLFLGSGFSLNASQGLLQGKRIIVDPGHGTINFRRKVINGGKETWEGIPEHCLTASIAEKLKEMLIELGAEVFLTRSQIDYWRPAYNSVDDNKSRAVYANELKGDALISIHCNWHPSKKARGVTTIYSKPTSQSLGKAIHRHLIRRLKLRDRKLRHDEFTILDQADMPAVIIEPGFMSHPREGKKLADPAFQKKIAQAVADGLIHYFQP